MDDRIRSPQIKNERTLHRSYAYVATEDMMTLNDQKFMGRLILLLFLIAGNWSVASVNAQKREPLLDLKLPKTTIESVETIGAGEFKPSFGLGASHFRNLPALRRVVGVIKPTSDSHIRFEVWLPVDKWNGNFRGVGNGGFAGVINYGDMMQAATAGYAVASTDTGHAAPKNGEEEWAVGHPEKVIDFAYRAIHEMTVKAKAIVKANYGRPPKFSYFSSCSNGGRQALMEAQRYPEDYDGIIAGAPAHDWTSLMTQGASIAQAQLKDAEGFIPRRKMKALEAAVLDSCDAEDGLKDGLIDDPRSCRFNPSAMLCQGDESDTCLTQRQVETLKSIYAGLRNSKAESLAPGLLPGSESGLGGWESWVAGHAPGKSTMNSITRQFFRRLVFADANWDFNLLNIDRDLETANRKLAGILNATNADLRAFKNRGGKLIIYHGWNDPAIPAEMSITYYQNVVAKMGQRDSDKFLRLYMVPGMQHCGSGPGPNWFSQANKCINCEPKQDINWALEQWVEKGVAPVSIIATKYEEEYRQTGVARTRPLCPYPQVARYDGSGSIDEAANFACVNQK